jgi:hypothetical protein
MFARCVHGKLEETDTVENASATRYDEIKQARPMYSIIKTLIQDRCEPY